MPPKRPNTKARVEFVKPRPAAIQLLDRQLTSADPDVRTVGVTSIPRIQAPVEPLTDSIAAKLEHQNWYTRRVGAEAAVKAIESRGASDVIVKEVLGQRLNHEDFETQRCAFEALVGIVGAATAPEPSKLIPPLMAEGASREVAARLEDQDPRVRENAIEAMTRMGETARPFMKASLALLTDEDASVRRRVVEMCTEIGVVATEALPQAAKVLQHQEAIFRRTAAKALVNLSHHSGEQVAQAVAQQLGACQDTTIRRTMLMLMVDLGPLFAPHGKILAQQLEDEDMGIRVSTTKALLAAGPGVASSSLGHVMKRMDHPNRDVRRSAVDCMRAMASMCPTYAQAVGKSLQEEPDDIPDVMRHKLAVYRILGGAEANAQPYLEDMSYGLEDKDWAVRRATIEAFEDLKDYSQEAAAMVAKRLLHYEPDVRRAAAECLGRMGMNAGPYANRVEAMLDTEEDEDTIEACKAAYEMLQQSGVFLVDFGSPPGSPASPGFSRGL